MLACTARRFAAATRAPAGAVLSAVPSLSASPWAAPPTAPPAAMAAGGAPWGMATLPFTGPSWRAMSTSADDGHASDSDDTAASATPVFTLQEQKRLTENLSSKGAIFDFTPSPTHLKRHFNRATDHSKLLDYQNVSTLDDPSQGDISRRTLGPNVSYCVFCAHGTSKLQFDNAALLSYFVSERGRILPRRVTKCCAKHQRKVRRVVKKARALNTIPYMHKLHPRLRFTSLKPNPVAEAAASQGRSGPVSPAASPNSVLHSALNDLRSAPVAEP